MSNYTMKSYFTSVVVLLMLISLSGCPKPKTPVANNLDYPPVPEASVIDLSINSNPRGATAVLSTGESCITPCVVKKRNDESFSVTVRKEGYSSATVQVSNNLARLREFNRKMAKRVDLNAIRVNALRLDPNPVVVNLEPSWTK